MKKNEHSKFKRSLTSGLLVKYLDWLIPQRVIVKPSEYI